MNHQNGSLSPSFFVEKIPVFGDIILSPMAGYSDLPFRSLCSEMGSAMSYTEFVSAQAILQSFNDRTQRMLSFSSRERPVVFQIFGNHEDCLVEAALRIQDLQPDIIDINMGCSVRQVSGRGSGAALLRDPGKIGRIFNRLVKALSVPVTGKIRLGWDQRSLNYLEVVKAMQENGASLVAVHGRTRDQAYKGQSNWDAIAEIVDYARIPVIGNGDVVTMADVARIKKQTGCAAVMVGRGAIGHPWIFQQRDRQAITFLEKAGFIRRHFESMVEFYGPRLSLLLIRKHVTRYLRGHNGIRDLQQQLVQVGSIAQFHQILDQLKERLAAETLQPA